MAECMLKISGTFGERLIPFDSAVFRDDSLRRFSDALLDYVGCRKSIYSYQVTPIVEERVIRLPRAEKVPMNLRAYFARLARRKK